MTAPALDRPDRYRSGMHANLFADWPRIALIIAAVAFVGYPILRGSGSEAGLAGAALYARPSWVLAHTLGMIGFTAAAWGIGGSNRIAGGLAKAGTILVLPYYGAEAFGLYAIGTVALQTNAPASVAAADVFRYQPIALLTFVAGLLLLAAAGVVLLVRAGQTAVMRRIGSILTALGLVTYLPQFFLPIEGRIAHGIVLGLGLVTLALTHLPGSGADRR